MQPTPAVPLPLSLHQRHSLPLLTLTCPSPSSRITGAAAVPIFAGRRCEKDDLGPSCCARGRSPRAFPCIAPGCHQPTLPPPSTAARSRRRLLPAAGESPADPAFFSVHLASTQRRRTTLHVVFPCACLCMWPRQPMHRAPLLALFFYFFSTTWKPLLGWPKSSNPHGPEISRPFLFFRKLEFAVYLG
jgi:hypothetical protein